MKQKFNLKCQSHSVKMTLDTAEPDPMRSKNLSAFQKLCKENDEEFSIQHKNKTIVHFILLKTTFLLNNVHS